MVPPPPLRLFHQPSTPLLREFVSQLLEAGAIQETNRIAFQGPLFSVPKKDSEKRRVILDLSTLNLHIVCPTFKMTTVAEVRSVLPQGAFTCSVDLTDAYWHVPVDPHFQPYLGFRLDNRKYKFLVMPFGLNIAPRVFTKLTRPIVQELRARGVCLVVYLDDWLVWAPSELLCRRHTKLLLKTLERRGFRVNQAKSRLNPAQVFEWLGVRWDTRSARIDLPEEKVISLSQDLLSFTNRDLISRREIERTLGRLQFASLVDPIGKALLKNLNGFLKSLATRRGRDRKVPFPPQLKTSLRRWLRPGTFQMSVPFRPPPISIRIFSDASHQGWGAHSSSGECVRGNWSVTMRTCHINILELVAIYLALRKLRVPRGSHIALHCDNSTAVNCLNRQGSSRSRPINSWVISILVLLKRRDLHLTAFHIAGVQNVVADALSRTNPIATEWELDQKSFSWMTQQWGVPQVDLFATRANRKVPAFISPVPDHLAVGLDAFTVDWNRWDIIYLFPPTAMLLKVLPLLESFRGTALIVTPSWPSKTWYIALASRAKEMLQFPDPQLSQTIGDKRFSNPSGLWNPLLCWKL